MTTTHVMLDLETQDSSKTAVIISIGAVAFNPNTGEFGERFSVNVDPETCLAVGLTRSDSTMKWWSAQSQAAQDSWKVNPISIQDALKSFSEFMGRNGLKIVWGNGSDFDNVILGNAYDAAKMPLPWRYSNNRCFRTMKGEFSVPEPTRMGTHHNGLDDAVHQAKWLVEIYKKFKPATLTTPSA